MKNFLNKKQIVTVVAVLSAGALVIGVGGVLSNYGSREVEGVGAEVNLYCVPEKEKLLIKGTVNPIQSISFKLEDGYKLDKVNVVDGQFVEKGKILYTAKNLGKLEELETLKKEISLKKKELKHEKDQEVLKVLKQEIEDMQVEEKAVRNSTVKNCIAPFTGKVYLDTDIETSESVFNLESTKYIVRGLANEFDYVKLSKGQTVTVQVLATKEVFSGVIAKIDDRAIDGDTFKNFAVEIDVPNQDGLSKGLSVQMTTQYEFNDIKVPDKAVKEESGKSFVLKYNNGIFEKSEVSIKTKEEEVFVISSGLKEGENIAKNYLEAESGLANRQKDSGKDGNTVEQ